MDTTITTKEREGTVYQDILKFIHVGLNITSNLLYAIEKVKRLPEIVAETVLPDSVVDQAAEAVEKQTGFWGTVISLINGLSYAFNVIKYLSIVAEFLEDREVCCCCGKIKNAPTWAKTIIRGIVILLLLRLALKVWTKHKDKIAFLQKKNKDWRRATSLVSKGGTFLYGIFQVVAMLRAPEILKDRKLYMICSAVNSLTAPLDMVGIDNLVYKSDGGEGIAYTAVYGTKVLVRVGQTAGLLMLKD